MSSQEFKDWASDLKIDPLILPLLQNKYDQPAIPQKDQFVKQRNLGISYATFLGVGAMIMVILLGVIHCTNVDLILLSASRTLLTYCVIGFIAGKIAEMCVRDSVKSMLRNMLQRSDYRQSEGVNDMTGGN